MNFNTCVAWCHQNCNASVILCVLYRDTIAARDRSISERDANNTELQRQIEVITDRLKVHVCGNFS